MYLLLTLLGVVLTFWWMYFVLQKFLRPPQIPEVRRPFQGRKQWALALAQPMVEAAGVEGFFEVTTDGLTKETRARLRTAFLHYMEFRANASDEEIRQRLKATLETAWFRADLRNLQPTDDPAAALAFACVRMAFFVRNATLLGWIDATTAWRVLLLNAQRAQDCFTGWAHFARAYCAGRQQWISAYRADLLGGNFTRTDVQRYRDTPASLWFNLPWPGQPAFSLERRSPHSIS
ncbi:MAG: DUF1266 domain-containing protein [Zoogloeaceae bacterium]|jgi:hypothetical protein|nr:DUF1266 domain-containing protein [Zoogloeaceae bacterium]